MFTKKELETIQKMVRATPIQGTVETLPAALELMISILQKCEVELKELEAADLHSNL